MKPWLATTVLAGKTSSRVARNRTTTVSLTATLPTFQITVRVAASNVPPSSGVTEANAVFTTSRTTVLVDTARPLLVNVSVYRIESPGSTLPPFSSRKVLSKLLKSGSASTRKLVGSSLGPVAGSSVRKTSELSPCTRPWLLMSVLFGTPSPMSAVNSTVALPPGGMSPRFHVTMLLTLSNVPPLRGTTLVSDGSTGSVTTTLTPVWVPVFTSVSV